MSFTGLVNTYIPLSINGLTQSFSDETNVGDLTCNSISIQGTKQPLLNFPVSQDNITRFNGTYKLQYTDETTIVFTATNASITFGVAVDLGSNNLSVNTLTANTVIGTDISGTNLIGNTLTIKNSSVSTTKYSIDYDEKTNNLDFNYITSSTNDKIFSLDQYGNLFLPQGLYFTGAVDHYIGNTALSNIIFSIQTAYKYSFLVNNIERAYIDINGFNTTNKIYLNDSATVNKWSLNTATDLKLIIAFNDGQIAYFSSATGFNTGQINFTTSLNSITPTVFGYLSGASSNIQTQINSINTSLSNVLLKTGTNTGVNTTFQLASGGSFIVGTGFTIDEPTATTSVFKLSVGTTFNTYQASYYDPTSSIQTQLDARITKTGTTTGCNPIIQLSSTGSFTINSSAPATIFSVSESTGICGLFKLNVNNTSSFGDTATFFGTVDILAGSLTVNNSTLDTFIKNLTSTSKINNVLASYYDVTSSINTSLSERITRTGTTTGVNAILRLLNAGSFSITNSLSDPIMLITNNTRDTYLYNLTSASQINGNSAGFYDPTSSLQTQLDAKISKTGSPTGINLSLYLSAMGSFGVYLSSFALALGVSATGLVSIPNLSCSTAITMGNSCILSSSNFKVTNATGQVNLYAVQFLADSTIPNGLTTEVASGELLLNSQINFRNTDVNVVQARQGLAFRLDNRAGLPAFQWYCRNAGSPTERQIMGLSSAGGLDIASLTNASMTINAPKITSYAPFVLCQASENGAVKISDSQVISLTANSANWSTGYTFSSIFTKYCEGSTVSIVGTVSCYVSSAISISIRIRFSNISTGIDYDVSNIAFTNVASNHAAVGISGQPNSSPGVSIPAGVYDVTFTAISSLNTDSNDYIRCLVFLSPGTP